MRVAHQVLLRAAAAGSGHGAQQGMAAVALSTGGAGAAARGACMVAWLHCCIKASRIADAQLLAASWRPA